MSVQASIVIRADQHFEVSTQSVEPDDDYFPNGVRIASVRFGDRFGAAAGGVITVQGDPEPMLALFDRIRSELVAACGKAWPVETAHVADNKEGVLT